MLLKALLPLALLVAQADTAPTLKVTSFRLAGENTRAAELCGVVSNGGDHGLVRAVVDPGTNAPGVYNTIYTKDGNFCVLVVTYTGRVEASVGTHAVAASIEMLANQER